MKQFSTDRESLVGIEILPLSQELLNSVRMETGELRISTGSEPRKFIEVAEYSALSNKTQG